MIKIMAMVILPWLYRCITMSMSCTHYTCVQMGYSAELCECVILPLNCCCIDQGLEMKSHSRQDFEVIENEETGNEK